MVDYRSFLQTLEQRRAFFQEMGARATDHAALTAYTTLLSDQAAGAIFQRALRNEASANDATQFTGHMLIQKLGPPWWFHDSLETLRQKTAQLPWALLDTTAEALIAKYCAAPIALADVTLHFCV